VPVVPFRVFEACRSCHRLSWHVLSWNWLLVQSSEPVAVPRSLVSRSRFAVGHSLGCAVFLPRAALRTLSTQCTLSASFAFLQSSTTRSSPPAAAGRPLSWACAPCSARGGGRPHHADLAAVCFGAPSGFGYPLDALLRPQPCRSCFVPAALLGLTLRSFLLTEGCRRVSTSIGPTCRFSCQ